jgi:hypothetical protein
MTAEFAMPDGTHIRVNDEDVESMPADWTRLDKLTDATSEEFVSASKIVDETEVKTKAPQAETKIRTPKK